MDEKADGGALGGHAGKTNVWESGVTDTHPLDAVARTTRARPRQRQSDRARLTNKIEAGGREIEEDERVGQVKHRTLFCRGVEFLGARS